MSLETAKPISKLQIYAVQILFAVSISVGYQGVSFDGVDDAQKWLLIIARYTVYLYLIRGTGVLVALSHNAFRFKQPLNFHKLYRQHQKDWLIFAGALATLVFCKQKVFGPDFVFLFAAKLVTDYTEMEKQSKTVTYGTGMACSFFEGYLTHVIPSDGHRFVGFAENIRVFEQNEGVVFPVKRLFIVVTKSLYCPPDLKLFNKDRPGLSYIEACKVSDRPLNDWCADAA
ncbi:uncharacterized protein LOC114365987 [Ostrinia furnacalis]|uniref:uncharacterized protein LOC114365987 n=1 Tax=Ostrinia furnacalis TaxID=93504 RepID=UPI00103DB055|nr:uncharacterized protein LOC114365987 [Ostrinia furnacalis]